jgi:hypothetical protein
MFPAIREWQCASELIKEANKNDKHTVIMNIDTRDIHGVFVEPREEFPFNGESVNLDDITTFFNKVRVYHWQWYKNMNCKYVRIFVDFTNHIGKLQNRYGKDITLQELTYQYGEQDNESN